MSKEKQEKRFVQFFSEDSGFFGPESSLVADSETGVAYHIIRNVFGSGITPLLNSYTTGRYSNKVTCNNSIIRIEIRAKNEPI